MSKIKTGGRKSFANPRGPHQDRDTINLSRMVERKQYAELEVAARQVLAGKPGHGFAMKALGFAMLGQGKYEEVLPLLRHSAALNPHDPELQHNLGIALSQLMYWDESILAFQQAIEGLPEDPVVHKDMGLALFRMQRWNDAVPSLLKAIELYDGDYIEAVELLALCLLNANRVDEAWTCYRELYLAEPEHVIHLFQLLYSSLRRCYWDGFDDLMQKLRALSSDFSSCPASPFALAAFPGIRQHEFLKVAEQNVAVNIPASAFNSSPCELDRTYGERRIRVGYLSGDLRRHAVGFIIPEVIERHDRSRFEVFAYATQGADPNDPIRPRLERAFEHFNDVGDLFVHNLREKIRADGIDILIDLAGWTAHGRPEVLALRSAPVQVNWLGYPGTMGHPILADYILGDPIVTPMEAASFYSETIAQMPDCYLPADTRRIVSKRPSRTEAGLPEGSFVFCSLNNSYKYNPAVFDLWAAILRDAPDSVLWLSWHGDTVAEHLWSEIERRGIGRERLIFARRVESNEDHIARLSLADLALDTFPYNSHSTGVDTLSAGVPMVSMLGELFASRVGASIAQAAGYDELVVADTEAYRTLALELFRDRARLSSLRARLLQGKPRLFDMGRFTRNLEAMFLRMLEDKANGSRRPLPAQAE